MSDYTPRKIYSDIEREYVYDDLILAVKKACVTNEAPNPFRTVVSIDENIKLVLNDTNDLEQVLRYYCDVLTYYDTWDHIIVGEKRNAGYSDEVLEKLKNETSYPTKLVLTDDWALFMLNTSEAEQLNLTNGIIKVTK